MYLSLFELGIFLAVVVVLAVGGFLLVALANLNRLVVHLNRKMTENSQHVQEIIENLQVSTADLRLLTGALRKNQQLFEEKIPGAINNLYAVSATIKNAGERVDDSLELVQTGLAETAATVMENTKDLLTYLRVASAGIRMIIEALLRK
ncbi:MAG: hypothetical protein KGZ76_05930 [Dethiobacter sp.]|jgi:hypothetical protein|nr:hypothetical protein [Dethiobacter sp.]